MQPLFPSLSFPVTRPLAAPDAELALLRDGGVRIAQDPRPTDQDLSDAVSVAGETMMFHSSMKHRSSLD